MRHEADPADGGPGRSRAERHGARWLRDADDQDDALGAGRAIRRAQRMASCTGTWPQLADCPHGAVRESRSMTVVQVEACCPRRPARTWLRAYISRGIMCGLRPGELLGLRWEDVDFAEGVIRVRKSVKFTEQADGSRRPIDRGPEDGALEAHARDARRGGPDAGRAAPRPGRAAAARRYRVHRSRPGVPQRRREPVLARDGPATVPRAVRRGRAWRELAPARAAAHVRLGASRTPGVDIDQIADPAGHINSNVTKTVYRHVLADQLATAADRDGRPVPGLRRRLVRRYRLPAVGYRASVVTPLTCAGTMIISRPHATERRTQLRTGPPLTGARSLVRAGPAGLQCWSAGEVRCRRPGTRGG